MSNGGWLDWRTLLHFFSLVGKQNKSSEGD